MPFHIVSIAEPSPRVLGKLRKGERVRIMKGEGFNLIVHSARYNPISKSFSKGKASTIELTPEEVQMNANPPEDMEPQLEGKGIGKTFKKLGRDIKGGFKKVGKALAPVGKVLLPVAKDIGKKLLKEGIAQAPELLGEMGGDALAAAAVAIGQPELAPIAKTIGTKLGQKGGRELGKFAGNKGERAIDRFDPYGTQKRANQPPSRIPDTNMLSAPSPMPSPSSSNPLSPDYDGSQGNGLYAQARGRGIRTHRMGTREVASIGIHGNLLGHGLPPALMSQPYSSNFQMASRLPPAFATVIRSGSGLYA